MAPNDDRANESEVGQHEEDAFPNSADVEWIWIKAAGWRGSRHGSKIEFRNYKYVCGHLKQTIDDMQFQKQFCWSMIHQVVFSNIQVARHGAEPASRVIH